MSDVGYHPSENCVRLENNEELAYNAEHREWEVAFILNPVIDIERSNKDNYALYITEDSKVELSSS